MKMRKLSLLLVFCLMLVCFASCKDDQTDGGSTDNGTTTTQATQTTEAPTDEESTKTPETPQSNWTGRY